MAVTAQHDLIHETSPTTGTGNLTTAAVNGKVQFGDATNGFGTGGTDVFDYFISNRDVAGEWERGTGHCSALGTLVRDTVKASSNANALVSFTAGTKDITNDIPAQQQPRVYNLHGAGRLTKSGANLLFAPSAGNMIVINGIGVTIPDAGVTLAPPATTLTLYYIYAFLSSGTLTLEASATTHATQAGTGVEIKSGDATRTLVGMARTVTNAWVDTAAQRFVVSYFNRRTLGGLAFFSASRNVVSTTYAEINTEIRNEFLTWADEAVILGASGETSQSTLNQQTFTSFGIDSTTVAEDVVSAGQAYTNGADTMSCSLMLAKSGLAEGYHYATLLGKVGANTGTWQGGGTAGLRCSLTSAIRG